MRKLIVITVGTSLLTNPGVSRNAPETERGIPVNLDGLNTYCDGLPDTNDADMAPDLLLWLAPFLTEDAVAQELGWRKASRPQNRDRLPQELSYLALIDEKWLAEGEVADVALLASNTPNGRLCAQVIADVLKDTGRSARWARFHLLPISEAVLFHEVLGLTTDRAGGEEISDGESGNESGAAARAFEDQGVPNLISALQELCQGRREVYINLTGGFKGAIPFSTLASAFLKAEHVTLHYLFENSDRIIALPSYPIGLDFGLWHQDATLLRAYQNAPHLFGPVLSPRMRAAAKELGMSTGPLSLPKLLAAAYEEQRTTDPLIRYSTAIIGRLLSPVGPYVGGTRADGGTAAAEEWESAAAVELGTTLTALVARVGDILWLGDKLPEMVDHALRHHHDLLELTERFLVPILYYSPDYLNARERFVLLSTVLLHDCGHSLDRISLHDCRKLEDEFGEIKVQGVGEEVALWPGDVRDYHQYLAGVRLNDVEMAADLGWPHPAGKTPLPEGLTGLHKAVILSCLYHRRRMEYDVGSSLAEVNKLHFTGQWPELLKPKADVMKEELGVDLMKIVALIRLIDGCDSQAHRAGPAARIDLSQSLLERDYDTAAQRARLAFDAVPTGERENIVEEERDASIGRWSRAWKVEDERRKTRIAKLQTLVNAATSAPDKQAARLWLIAGEAAERAYFRSTPWPHYMKHRAVSSVEVVPDKEFGPQNHVFHIVLEPNTNTEQIEDKRTGLSRTLLGWLDEAENPVFPPEKLGDPKTLRGVIEDEVSSEYREVARYAAEQFHLKAHFWWADQWALFQADGSGSPFYPKPDVPDDLSVPSV